MYSKFFHQESAHSFNSTPCCGQTGPLLQYFIVGTYSIITNIYGGVSLKFKTFEINTQIKQSNALVILVIYSKNIKML